MKVTLTVTDGRATKESVPLELPASIGRSRAADLPIAHPLVSRAHCRIEEKDGLAILHDEGSLNGTYIGRNRVATAPLLPESIFSVGPLSFRIDYEYTGPTDSLPETVLAERQIEDNLNDTRLGPGEFSCSGFFRHA
ncbi:MAG: FHA domain-containing protein [Planctomycetia bacterium]|jgi:pSer/pThr/pTyr-binding forkhead associated (FHA) protein